MILLRGGSSCIVLHITCRMTLCFSVCAPSHLAHSWVQRAEVSGGSLVLLGISHGMHPYSLVRFVGGVASPPHTKSGCAIIYNLVHSFNLEWIGTVWLCSIKSRKPPSLFAFLWCRSFLLSFLSPCSTQFNVRGLETMSRMCHC